MVSFMNSLQDVLQQRLQRLEKPKSNISHEFQYDALELWKKLRIEGKPTGRYFACFKKNGAAARQAIYFVTDANARDPLKLFFWKFNKLNAQNPT